MRLFISIVCVVILFQSALNAEVTLQNLKLFFEATYDTNKDNFATLQEFIEYFQFM